MRVLALVLVLALTVPVVRSNSFLDAYNQVTGALANDDTQLIEARTLGTEFVTCTYILKMLGLYLYTLIIGHNFCKMLSTLNNLTLQMKLQSCETNNVLLDKKVKPEQQ